MAAKRDDSGGIADKVTDLVRPGFVPRPIAKAILFSFGAGFVWSLVQKVCLSLLIQDTNTFWDADGENVFISAYF